MSKMFLLLGLFLVLPSFGQNRISYCPLDDVYIFCIPGQSGPNYMLEAGCNPFAFNPSHPQCYERLQDDSSRRCYFCCIKDNDILQNCSDITSGEVQPTYPIRWQEISIASKVSHNECIALCKQDKQCQTWNYNLIDSTCTLRKKVGPAKDPSPSINVGYEDCAYALYKMMIEMMENCLLSREENIITNESISACRAGVEKSLQELLNWNEPETEYHAGINDPAVLITGGYKQQSAEIYQPHRDSACVLPDLPEERFGHTQDGSLLCGGWETDRFCRRWNPKTGAWDLVTESLTEKRVFHISWTPADGSVTYLLGGARSKYTSEVIDNHNNVRASFRLQHDTLLACSIPDPDTDTVLVTGGYHTPTTVSRYGKEGWMEDFSSGLKTGRYHHGCSSFLTKDNEKVLLVTGGSDITSDHHFASTEVYYPSAGEWREVPGSLPFPMAAVGVVTLNNRVLLFGAIDWTIGTIQYTDILQFSVSKGEENWTKVGEMSQSRYGHAVSIVDMNNFKKYCQ